MTRQHFGVAVFFSGVFGVTVGMYTLLGWGGVSIFTGLVTMYIGWSNA